MIDQNVQPNNPLSIQFLMKGVASPTSVSLNVLHSSNATNQRSATRLSPTSNNSNVLALRGIFLGFPDNSAGWLIYSPDQPQSLIVIRDAYFDEDFSSALCFDSKPFAGAVPIRSHFNPNGLCNTQENSEPSTFHQTGSAANLGNLSIHFS